MVGLADSGFLSSLGGAACEAGTPRDDTKANANDSCRNLRMGYLRRAECNVGLPVSFGADRPSIGIADKRSDMGRDRLRLMSGWRRSQEKFEASSFTVLRRGSRFHTEWSLSPPPRLPG